MTCVIVKKLRSPFYFATLYARVLNIAYKIMSAIQEWMNSKFQHLFL